MSRKNRPALNFEQLDSRINPGVDATIGTLQIVETTANHFFSLTGDARSW